MKRFYVLAAIAAVSISGSMALPVQAASAEGAGRQWKAKAYVIKGSQEECLEQAQDILSELCDKFGNLNWNDCPVITPPETDLPENDQPETNVPETDKPETDVPETDKPETDVPETDKPETNVPETDKPETNKPGTDQPETDTQERSFAEQVVDLVNKERVKAGLGEVVLDKEIEAAALVRAKEIEVSFSHTRPDGTKFSTALTDAGISFRGAGENIAWGQKSPEAVMEAWMNSDGHRANILNPQFTKMGAGYYQNSAGRKFWTQLFTY